MRHGFILDNGIDFSLYSDIILIKHFPGGALVLFRKTLRKIIPSHAIFPLILTGVSLAMSFGLAKVIQAFVSFNYRDISMSVDLFFSFRPEWVLIYVGSYVFWFLTFTSVARESPRKACFLAAADMASKFLCLLFFVFLPTTNIRPEFEVKDFFTFGMNVIYSADTPTNLFPSMHCSIAWMGTVLLFRSGNLKHKIPVCIFSLIFCILIFLSTLYTKQHVVVDVIGGILVAELGLLLARFTPLTLWIERLNERFMKTKLASIL